MLLFSTWTLVIVDRDFLLNTLENLLVTTGSYRKFLQQCSRNEILAVRLPVIHHISMLRLTADDLVVKFYLSH